MTKRDEAVFAEAFNKMEAKGYFVGLRDKAKTKVKSTVIKTAQKPRRAAADSVSPRCVATRVPLAAHKK